LAKQQALWLVLSVLVFVVGFLLFVVTKTYWLQVVLWVLVLLCLRGIIMVRMFIGWGRCLRGWLGVSRRICWGVRGVIFRLYNWSG